MEHSLLLPSLQKEPFFLCGISEIISVRGWNLAASARIRGSLTVVFRSSIPSPNLQLRVNWRLCHNPVGIHQSSPRRKRPHRTFVLSFLYVQWKPSFRTILSFHTLVLNLLPVFFLLFLWPPKRPSHSFDLHVHYVRTRLIPSTRTTSAGNFLPLECDS